jgi:ubiquinone/menaquinone biosynthesis C-methylase UbiE/DNA-binding transcriptional ArsR family regulator
MESLPGLFRLLGDEARLRILRLLASERLNVSELTTVLGIAQSGVSRHLGLLAEAGLVLERREGAFTWFSLAPALGPGNGALGQLLHTHFADSARDPRSREDQARLQEVLRLRKENFDVHASPDARRTGQLVPGRSWAAWARALAHLLPPLRVADLGCGEGYLTVEASRFASRVIAVDRSAEVLKRARALARRRKVNNVTWRRGEIEKVPIKDGGVDVAVLSQALHHAADPARAVAEAARVVAPDGKVLVLDLRAHGEGWVRDRLGDRWQGFEDGALARLLKEAGLKDVRVGVGARKSGDPFTVLVASGRKT